MTLLHTCCGPCASACVPRLKDQGREVVLFFANSNIDTEGEFEKRLASARRLAEAEGVELVALPYDHEDWLRQVADGFECEKEKGLRCARCFRYHFEKAAAYAASHGFADWTTSLSVSPHKVSKTIFAAAATLPNFLAEDFKKGEGFKLSCRRARELGLYRQEYCGCEFSRGASPAWTLHHKEVTVSTNLDAREGVPGDVFTADFQTAGRGRLDHKWLSPPKTNVMMSAVFDVEDLACEEVATFPLVVGLAVARAVSSLLRGLAPADAVKLKWPNDILVNGRKVAGILCERVAGHVIAGIGVNVLPQTFAPEIASRAMALGDVAGFRGTVPAVRETILRALTPLVRLWRERGFKAVHPKIVPLDFLKGRTLSVWQTDDDPAPLRGRCDGIAPDGSLTVAGRQVYAGEAHIDLQSLDREGEKE